MTDHIVTCAGAEVDQDGVLYSCVVYSNGEDFYSYVCKESDVGSRSEENVQTMLYERSTWLTGIWRASTSELFVSDADGAVHCSIGGWKVNQVSTFALNSVWGFSNDSVYVGGDEGVVYRWDGKTWTSASPALDGKILCIRGTSPNDLYVCGEDALFWHYNGSAWSQIDLPTRQVLTGLLTISPTDAMVAGQGGVLFRGNGNKWSDLSTPGHDFYELAIFDDVIHIAGGGEGVFEFDGAALKPIKDNIAVYGLSAFGGYLAVSGMNLAGRYDGKGWVGARYT